MSHIVHARIVGNERVSALIADLAEVGIQRQRIHVNEPLVEPEHGADPVTSGGTLWGVIGGIGGLAFGWIVMSWTSLPWIGALWGAVVGSISGARMGAYAASSVRGKNISCTQVGVEVCDQAQAEQVRGICTEHQAWGIEVTPTA